MISSRHIAAVAGALACAMLAASGPALAKDSQLAWEGYATTTSSTAACAGIGGTGKNDTHVSIFRPHIGAKDTDTFLSMMHLRAAITFDNTSESTVHQMHGSGNYTAYGINSRAKGFSYKGTYSLTVSPASVTAATAIVNITGTLKNYFNTAGCNVTFKGVYVKRID